MKNMLIVMPGSEKEFQIHFNHISITFQQENSQFKDVFSWRVSYPFDMLIDRDVKMALGSVNHLQSVQIKNFFPDCIWVYEGKIYQAELTIIEVQGHRIKAQIHYGMEQFPCWNTPISELNLGEAHIADAPQIINKSYEQTSYNYPMVITDAYSSDPAFKSFKKVYNLRVDNAFVKNKKEENTHYNYNIMMPMPYWLFVIKKGIEQAGYTLHGDVLNDKLIQKMILVPTKKVNIYHKENAQIYFKEIKGDEKPITQPINVAGYFRLHGKVEGRYAGLWENPAGYIEIYLFNTKTQRKTSQLYYQEYPGSRTCSFDFYFDVPEKDCYELRIRSHSRWIYSFKNFEATLMPYKLYDDNGNEKMQSSDFKTIKLNEYLPDISFGNLILATKNMFNLGFEIKDDFQVHMNYNHTYTQQTPEINLGEYQVKQPHISFEEKNPFLLQYTQKEDENLDHFFEKILYNKKGMKIVENFENEKVNKIEIPVYALPIKQISIQKTDNNLTEVKINTVQIPPGESSLCVCLYDGLQEGKNQALPRQLIKPSELFHLYWRQWFSFRQNSYTVKWSFVALKNKLRKLHASSLIYAYHQKMLIKSLTKKSVNEQYNEIEIEADIIN